ncbi:conjugative transposon protein TraM [Mucilaginibacter sp. BJC16-A38]|uniref:conjugative transposon protein TraM n=1 Tax=Mucilaginibacter phenanthrenivorans TaxID=1234842 RepID=UPI0021580B21|nr:conjugative transposon protein TraM [Mucilaginibacter phenanthrenivorans]MCR8560459.1 conjugative transposon protein TraM [Mucilaginibacter phenanthrenivorans]
MNSTPEERKQKMLLFLPLLVLPFLALGFYALGGGKGNGQLSAAGPGRGINTELPGARLAKGKDDKYSLYEKAKRDSTAANAKSSAEVFASLGWDTATFRHNEGMGVAKVRSTGVTGSGSATDNEAKIAVKLAEINRQINAPPVVTPVTAAGSPIAASTAELDRLEKLLKEKQEAGPPDPQLQQLNGMLDKLMQIQHPVSALEKQAGEAAVKAAVKDSAFRAIPALIDGNQKVLQGGMVRLRLQDTVTLGGISYPKGQVLSGLCVIANQRLLLEIRNIRLGSSIIPVSLTVFSLDGMPGINAPEAELGEAAGNGTAGALDNMEFPGMDESLGTQAAAAGISAAKTLIGKKVRRVKVKLKGGEAVLLRNNQSGRR